MQVDPHGHVEVLLAPAAQHRGEVKHRYILPVDQPADRLRVGDFACLKFDALIEICGTFVRHRHVEQDDFIDLFGLSLGTGDPAECRKPPPEQEPDESSASRNDHFHVRSR